MAHPLKNIPPVKRSCSHCGKSYSWGPKYTKRIVAGTMIDLCNDCGFIVDAAREKLENEQLNPWLDNFVRKYFKPRHLQTNSESSPPPPPDQPDTDSDS